MLSLFPTYLIVLAHRALEELPRITKIGLWTSCNEHIALERKW